MQHTNGGHTCQHTNGGEHARTNTTLCHDRLHTTTHKSTQKVHTRAQKAARAHNTPQGLSCNTAHFRHRQSAHRETCRESRHAATSDSKRQIARMGSDHLIVGGCAQGWELISIERAWNVEEHAQVTMQSRDEPRSPRHKCRPARSEDSCDNVTVYTGLCWW